MTDVTMNESEHKVPDVNPRSPHASDNSRRVVQSKNEHYGMATVTITPGTPDFNRFLTARNRSVIRGFDDVSIAITGYGGPEGGEDGTPAGTVWFAWHIKGQTYTAVMHFAGDCETVLALAVRFALAQLLQLLL